LGSIPFAFIYAKIFKRIDIRKHGSGNIGATNVLRILGPLAGTIVLILDMMKGFLPIVIMKLYFFEYIEANSLLVCMALCAILGHTFPIFMKFKGGKGVATAAGVCLALMPLSIIGALVVFITIVATTKYVSVGSLIASLTLFVIRLIVYFFDKDIYTFSFIIMIVIFLIYKHKSNINRLMNGTENTISFKRTKKDTKCVE